LFVFAEHSSERLQRRMNASILSLSPARVKPIQALTAYVSFAKNYSVEYVVHTDHRGLDRVLAMSLTQNNTD